MYNLVKLYFGFQFSRISGKAWQPAYPFSISIEPTTSCNLRCPQCPSGLRQFTRPTGMLQKEFFLKLLPQFIKYLHGITFYFQGEPYLNPDFTEMVRLANANGIYTSTSTNAHYLSPDTARQTVESGLDQLVISIDGGKQETYSTYRVGGQFNKVLEGTRNIIEQKKALGRSHPHVVWQFIVFRHNQDEIQKIKALGKKMGVNEVRIKTAQVYDFENSSEWIPDQEKYSRYTKTSSGTYRIKNKLLNQCWRMWQACVITWDGKVVPCCFDKDARHQLGNLNTESFSSVWFSEPYNAFRGAILKGRNNIDICNNCTEGTRVFA